MLWWKIYFWIYLIFSIFGFIYVGQTLLSWTIADWSNLIISVIFGVGIYGYTFKKRILSPRFWKYIFWISLIFAIFNLTYGLLPESLKSTLEFFIKNSYPVSTLEVIISVIATIPALYAIYKISRPQKSNSN